MKTMTSSVLATVLMLAGLVSCSKDKDRGETNQEEVITTMELRFTPQGGGTPIVFEFDDPDGPGGSAPVQDAIELVGGTSYDVTVTLLNKTANPVENITDEVEEESVAHRFYYIASAGSNITIDNLNDDDNGISLGTASRWTAGAAGTGSVVVVLRHYPGEPPNKAEADPADSPKSGTDISVTFATTVL